MIDCTEVVHILSSDDEEDKAATSVATGMTQSTSAACSVVTSLTHQVCRPLHQFQIFISMYMFNFTSAHTVFLICFFSNLCDVSYRQVVYRSCMNGVICPSS